MTRYGIYDSKKGEFVFGIDARNKCEAYRTLFSRIGRDSYDERYNAQTLNGEPEPPSFFRWGIWNRKHKGFQFCISADSVEEASRLLYRKVGDSACSDLYEVRKIPIKRRCPICGKEFTTLQVEQKFCCKQCAKNDKQKRKQERVMDGGKERKESC